MTTASRPRLDTLVRAAQRLLGWWQGVAEARHPALVIGAACIVLTLPLLFLRSFYSVEAVTATVAKGAIEDGHWLTPYMYNLRWVERPHLLGWIVAVISLPFGHVGQVTTRLPVVLSLVAGCWLIFQALRPLVPTGSALFGAGLLLASPLVIRGYVLGLADLPLAVMLFVAFLLWWSGFSKGGTTLARWIGIGVLLGLAGLMKGPQPLGYFFLGVGLFILLTRNWRELPGLVLAGIVAATPVALWYGHVYIHGDQEEWARYMRLGGAVPTWRPAFNVMMAILEVLPAALSVGVFLIDRALRRERGPVPGLVLALGCYAFTCTLVVAFWPQAVATRYFYPMVPAICALGGLAYGTLTERRPIAAAGLLAALLGVLAYAAIYSLVVVPANPGKFRLTEIEGDKLGALVRAAPAPLYRTQVAALSELFYAGLPVIEIDPGAVGTLPRPAWLVVHKDELEGTLAAGKGRYRVMMSFGGDRWRLLRADG